jgi:D-alanyl-D-alanine carboxypeptidase
VTAVPQALLTSVAFTGGGLEAQLDDVARIFRAMFDGTLLTDESLEAFTTTVLDTNYGLGISVDDFEGSPVYSHGGGVPGFRSHAFYAPELDVAAAMSANLIPVEPDVGTLADAVLGVLQQALTP